MKIKANIFRSKYSSGMGVYHAYIMLATKKRKLVISTSTPDSIPGNDIYILPIPVLAISKTPGDYNSQGTYEMSLRVRWFKWEWVILRVSIESLMTSKYSKYKYSTAYEDEYPVTPEDSIAQEQFTSQNG